MPRTSPGSLRGALALDPRAYADLAERPSATPLALLSVVVATVLAGLGGLLWTRWAGHPSGFAIEPDAARFAQRSLIQGGLIQLVMWGGWVLTTWVYLRSFGEAAGLTRLVRVMGVAFLPMGLQVFLPPPGLELAVAAVAFGYTIAAMVAGVQAAADTTAFRALVSVLAGFVLFAVVLGLLGNGAGDRAPGIFALDPVPASVQTKPAPH